MQNSAEARPGIRWREIIILLSTLAVGKVVIILALYYYRPSAYDVWPIFQGVREWIYIFQSMSYEWDGTIYLHIAQFGYPKQGLFEFEAFSPVYPELIRLVYAAAGSYWESSLIVTNIFSFIFPLILLKFFDLRTALLAEMFPTYLVYTTVGYSDAIALVFLSLALVFFLKKRFLLSGVALGLAALVLYDLIVAAAAYLLYMLFFQKIRTLRPYLSFLGPVVLTGVSILAAYQIFTGSAFTFFDLERTLWGVVPTNPVGQIEWLLRSYQLGSFTGVDWSILGIPFTAQYWVVRNLLFEGFFFVGIYLLARLSHPYKWLFVVYSCTLAIPLLFVEGTPVFSIPRLILPAFPVFLGYSQKLFTGRWSLIAYIVVATMVACFVLLAHVYAFFA